HLLFDLTDRFPGRGVASALTGVVRDDDSVVQADAEVDDHEHEHEHDRRDHGELDQTLASFTSCVSQSLQKTTPHKMFAHRSTFDRDFGWAGRLVTFHVPAQDRVLASSLACRP